MANTQDRGKVEYLEDKNFLIVMDNSYAIVAMEREITGDKSMRNWVPSECYNATVLQCYGVHLISILSTFARSRQFFFVVISPCLIIR